MDNFGADERIILAVDFECGSSVFDAPLAPQPLDLKNPMDLIGFTFYFLFFICDSDRPSIFQSIRLSVNTSSSLLLSLYLHQFP